MKLDKETVRDAKATALFLLGCIGFAVILICLGCQSREQFEARVQPDVERLEFVIGQTKVKIESRGPKPVRPLEPSPGIKLLLDSSKECQDKFGLTACLFCTTQPDVEQCLVESYGKDWTKGMEPDEFAWAHIEAQLKVYRIVLLDACMIENGKPGIRGCDESELLRLKTSKTGAACIEEIESMPLLPLFEKGAATVKANEDLSKREGL